jgi:hypothetical protein
MRCPFCHQTIEFEFRAGEWIAMRDGREHSCNGLIQAQSASQGKTGQKSPRQESLVADEPVAQARPAVVPQHEDYPPWEDAPAPVVATPTIGASQAPTKPSKTQPVQLELKAID